MSTNLIFKKWFSSLPAKIFMRFPYILSSEISWDYYLNVCYCSFCFIVNGSIWSKDLKLYLAQIIFLLFISYLSSLFHVEFLFRNPRTTHFIYKVFLFVLFICVFQVMLVHLGFHAVGRLLSWLFVFLSKERNWVSFIFV